MKRNKEIKVVRSNERGILLEDGNTGVSFGVNWQDDEISGILASGFPYMSKDKNYSFENILDIQRFLDTSMDRKIEDLTRKKEALHKLCDKMITLRVENKLSEKYDLGDETEKNNMSVSKVTVTNNLSSPKVDRSEQ